MITREQTKKVLIKDVVIGGSNNVVIQTMTTTKTKNVNETVSQINTLATAGSAIVRLAIFDMEDAIAIKEIKKQVTVPLVADIHFDYRLALKCIENDIDKIRINPGNIGNKDKIKQVVDKCKEKRIPIRIGINGGSLEKHIIEKYGVTAKGMLESAKYHVNLLEELSFNDIIISLKSLMGSSSFIKKLAVEVGIDISNISFSSKKLSSLCTYIGIL